VFVPRTRESPGNQNTLERSAPATRAFLDRVARAALRPVRPMETSRVFRAAPRGKRTARALMHIAPQSPAHINTFLLIPPGAREVIKDSICRGRLTDRDAGTAPDELCAALYAKRGKYAAGAALVKFISRPIPRAFISRNTHQPSFPPRPSPAGHARAYSLCARPPAPLSLSFSLSHFLCVFP